MHLSTTRLAVVLALLMVTAGCAGLSDGPDASETATPTADREPTTTFGYTIDLGSGGNDGTTTDDDGFPDGYDADGFASGTVAVQTHLEALQNERYNVTYWLRNRSNGGRLSVDGTTRRASLAATIDGSRYETYTIGNATLQRVRSNGTATVEEINATPSDVHRAFALSAVTRSYYLSNYTLADTVDGDDGSVYVYAADGANQNLDEYDPDAFSNVSGSFRVDESGRILRYEWVGTYRNDTYQYRYQLSDRGEADVRRPSWVDTAIENTSTTAPTTATADATTAD